MSNDEISSEVKQEHVLDCAFGSVQYTDGEVYNFPDGLYGFEKLKKFVLWSEQKFYPFRWLISLDDPDMSFPVIDPMMVMPDYAPNVRDYTNYEEKLVIVAIGNPDEPVTANLRAPVLMSAKRRCGKQIILTDANYPLRYQLVRG